MLLDPFDGLDALLSHPHRILIEIIAGSPAYGIARADFISKEAFGSHLGSAQAQIKKARGRNKIVRRTHPNGSR